MKGYYTVKLVGGEMQGGLRISLETRFARALEAALGGPENVKALCLTLAASGERSASMNDALRSACTKAEEAAWSGCDHAPGARFTLAAWQARDLA